MKLREYLNGTAGGASAAGGAGTVPSTVPSGGAAATAADGREQQPQALRWELGQTSQQKWDDPAASQAMELDAPGEGVQQQYGARAQGRVRRRLPAVAAAIEAEKGRSSVDEVDSEEEEEEASELLNRCK